MPSPLADVDGTLIHSVGETANKLHKDSFAHGMKTVFGVETHIGGSRDGSWAVATWCESTGERVFKHHTGLTPRMQQCQAYCRPLLQTLIADLNADPRLMLYSAKPSPALPQMS